VRPCPWGESFNGDRGGSGGAGGAGGGDDGGGAPVLTARATAINVDDGSLGGWLPVDRQRAAGPGGAGGAAVAGGAIPPWKVYIAVVLAQYPLYELNILVVLPALDALGPEYTLGFTTLPQAVRGLAVATWTSAGAVFVTLPAAQRALRAYGFIGTGGAAGGGGGGGGGGHLRRARRGLPCRAAAPVRGRGEARHLRVWRGGRVVTQACVMRVRVWVTFTIMV
jgi:hypothetical protein